MMFIEPVGRYHPGQEIEVLYRGEWYRACVKTVNHDGTVDADWGDGTYAAGLSVEEVRPMRKDVSPSPPRDTGAGASRPAAPHLSPPPPVGKPAPTPWHLPPLDADALYRSVLARAGWHPLHHHGIPETDFLGAFGSRAEAARELFCNPDNPLLLVGRHPPLISPRRFAGWLGSVDPSVTLWVSEALKGQPGHGPAIPHVPPPPPPPPPPLQPSPAVAASEPLQEQQQQRHHVDPLAGVDAKVNMSGSPHRTRQEAEEARACPPPPAAEEDADHGLYRSCVSACRHRPGSPLRDRHAGAAQREGRSRSRGRGGGRGLPPALVVSGVLKRGLKTNLNGRYRRAARKPSDDRNGVVTRYRKEAGGAVLYQTKDGRWRVNDSESAIGWVYSNQRLLGQWEESPGAGDFTGASGTPYPSVTPADQRSTSPAATRRPDSLAATSSSKPGNGIMSSGTPRMTPASKPSTDAIYNTAGSIGRYDRSRSVGKVQSFSSSFGSAPRFHPQTIGHV